MTPSSSALPISPSLRHRLNAASRELPVFPLSAHEIGVFHGFVAVLNRFRREWQNRTPDGAVIDVDWRLTVLRDRAVELAQHEEVSASVSGARGQRSVLLPVRVLEFA